MSQIDCLESIYRQTNWLSWCNASTRRKTRCTSAHYEFIEKVTILFGIIIVDIVLQWLEQHPAVYRWPGTLLSRLYLFLGDEPWLAWRSGASDEIHQLVYQEESSPLCSQNCSKTTRTNRDAFASNEKLFIREKSRYLMPRYFFLFLLNIILQVALLPESL